MASPSTSPILCMNILYIKSLLPTEKKSLVLTGIVNISGTWMEAIILNHIHYYMQCNYKVICPKSQNSKRNNIISTLHTFSKKRYAFKKVKKQAFTQPKACQIVPILKLKATKPALYILIICRQTYTVAWSNTYL